MEKNIFLIGLLVSTISCGKQTENIDLKSNVIALAQFKKASVKSSELDPNLRSVTLIAYPNADEIKGFSYRVDDKVFNTVFSSEVTEFKLDGDNLSTQSKKLVSYGDSMPKGITKNISSNKKVSNLVTQLVNIGDVRDKAYLEFTKIEKLAKTFKTKISAVETRVDTELTFFKIRDSGPYKNKYVLSEIDGYKLKEQKTKNCDQLISSRLPDVALDLISAEETALLEEITAACSALDSEFSTIETLNQEQKKLIFDYGSKTIPSTSIFYNGKTYVTLMLDALRDHVGKTFLSTGVFKESIFDGTYSDPLEVSRMTFTDSGEVAMLSLRLDFLGRGVRTYSLDNGLIKNVFFSSTSLGEKVLHLEIDGGDVTVKAKLGMTLMSNFGLRFIGDADFFFTNGTKNRGVMKIEVDSLLDPTLPSID